MRLWPKMSDHCTQGFPPHQLDIATFNNDPSDHIRWVSVDVQGGWWTVGWRPQGAGKDHFNFRDMECGVDLERRQFKVDCRGTDDWLDLVGADESRRKFARHCF